MISYNYPAYDQLERAVAALGDMADELLFVGGTTIGLYLTEAQVREPRPTEDVDTVCAATTLDELYQYGNRLKSLGFREDETSSVICRWRKEDIILDLMPVDESVLGFSNRWYGNALNEPWVVTLRSGTQIGIPRPATAIACKMEAFTARGDRDFAASKDFEDIVVVIDGRAAIVSEVASSPEPMLSFIRSTLEHWLQIEDFSFNIAAHLAPDAASQARREIVLERLKSIVAQAAKQED